MAIRITYNGNTISSIGKTEDLEFTPDDRQEIIKTVTSSGTASVTVEDYGVVANGEVISLSAVFSSADYNTLKTYWSARNRVNVVLDDGTTINNARLVIRGTKYYDNLMPQYKTVNLEVWKV